MKCKYYEPLYVVFPFPLHPPPPLLPSPSDHVFSVVLCSQISPSCPSLRDEGKAQQQ